MLLDAGILAHTTYVIPEGLDWALLPSRFYNAERYYVKPVGWCQGIMNRLSEG